MARPLPRAVLRSDVVLYRDDGCWRQDAGNYVSENVFPAASTAGAFEDADVTGFASGIITVDDGQILAEPERLVLGKGIHTAVVEYGRECNGWGGVALDRYVALVERSDVLRLG